MKFTLWILFSTFSLFCFPVWGQDPETPLLPQNNFVAVIQEAKQQVFPVIVWVKAIREDYSRGKREKQQITGSGVIISNDGYVVTNNHVAEKTTEIFCVLANQYELPATIVGLDNDVDVALLKLDLSKFPGTLNAAQFGNSDLLQEGDFVMTMGCPFGLTRSVSFGVISNTKRYLEGTSKYNLWLQTDASINPGNSGGPLVNIEGKIVGINTLAIRNAQIGFAIPSNVVQEVVTSLKEKGRVDRAWTGIQFQALKDFEKSTFYEATNGVLVASVDPESPADLVGIRPGDLLLSLNELSINGLLVEDLPNVRRIFSKLPLETPTRIIFKRGEEQKSIELTPRLKGKVEGEEKELEEWQMTIKSINQFNNPELYYFQKKGCYIFNSTRRGNATTSGLNGGDVVLEIEKTPIESLEGCIQKYEELNQRAKGERKALFKVLREGLTHLVVLDYEKRKADFEEED